MIPGQHGGNRKKKTYRSCEICGKVFYPKGGSLKQKTCSRECGYKLNVHGGKKGKHYPHTARAEIRNCLVCGNEFRAVKDFSSDKCIRKQLYCSKDCWTNRGSHVATVSLNCEHCGNEFTAKESENRRYCSRDCAHVDMVGEKAAQYKDGKSLLRDRARLSQELNIWRLAVYKRDNYICQECGEIGRIHAHHIKHWADYPEHRFDVDNGITLCETCHGKKHNMDFSKRVSKICSECEAPIKNRTNTGLCHSCAMKRWHRERKEKESEHYCDIIISRWEQFTGQTAQRIN